MAAGASADLSHFVPSATLLYLIGGIALGALGSLFCSFPGCADGWAPPRPLSSWRSAANLELMREPKRLRVIVLVVRQRHSVRRWRCGPASRAFGGGTTFVTVTVVTMVGGTLASGGAHPGGVGAVEAALIGGLAAFGVPAAIGVPSVLLAC